MALMNLQVIEGGAEPLRLDRRALEAVDPSCEFVAIHDAARPCLTSEQVDAVFDAARTHGAALLAIPIADTVKRVNTEKFTTETVSRHDLYLAQTPQVFLRELIVRAYANRARLGPGITDDSQLVEAIGHPCAVVEGTPANLKITTSADLRLAAAILNAQPKTRREGPAHPFADEHAMWDATPKIKPKDLFK